MRSKIFFVIMLMILLLIKINCLDEELDYYEVDKKYYGMKEFTDENERNLFLKQYDILIDITKLYDEPGKFSDLSKYYNLINDTLLGYQIKSCFKIFIPYEVIKNNLFNDLNEYLKKSENNHIKDILESWDNWDEYIGSNFTFITNLKWKEFDAFSMILPDVIWKMQPSSEKNFWSCLAGEDSYTGMVDYAEYNVGKDFDINNDKRIYFEGMAVKNAPEKSDDIEFYRIKSGKIILINENVKVGSIKFIKIYEQVTCSSNKYNYQVYVNRRRFYITDDKIYIIGLTHIISGKHALADRDDLINQSGLLLDTVNFINK